MAGDRAAGVPPGPDPARTYAATTVQAAGLFPFVAGSGAPTVGVPIGRHMLWGEVVCLDPFAWMAAGLATNTGMFVLGQPGVGKSALAKRLITRHGRFGVRPIILGDTKAELHRHRRSPRRAGHPRRPRPGPHQPARRRPARRTPPPGMPARAGRGSCALEIRGRRLTLPAGPVRPGPRRRRRPGHQRRGGHARPGRRPAHRPRAPATRPCPTCCTPASSRPAALIAAAEAPHPPRVPTPTRRARPHPGPALRRRPARRVRRADHPPARPGRTRGVSVDISAHRRRRGHPRRRRDAVPSGRTASAPSTPPPSSPTPAWPAAASTWWSWTSCGGRCAAHPGLVEHADALTRLNRSRGIASLMITHSLADLDALPTRADGPRPAASSNAPPSWSSAGCRPAS